MLYRAKAPLRISFAGGGTDVSPFFETYGGCVLNATIDKYAYTSLETTSTRSIELESLDFDAIAQFEVDQTLEFNGEMDLAKAVIRRLNGNQGSNGFRILTHNDAPPGSGLGSSSAMVVSLLGAFNEWRSLSLSDYEIAQMAYDVERSDLGITGGKQDQYACAFGGFNFIEFGSDYVVVNPLRIKPHIVNELQYNLLLCYTGKNRLSSRIIESQVKNLKDGREDNINAMLELKSMASDMKRMLLTGNTRGFGELLHHAWQSKKRMAKEISNSLLDQMYDEARTAGAIGGKVSGAGGGGFMMFYCDNGKKHKVAERLKQLGGEVIDFRFEQSGLQSWQTGLMDSQTPCMGEISRPDEYRVAL
jgi:D-glycero-alpha-D-manno-heptose-7-phosphate kinase